MPCACTDAVPSSCLCDPLPPDARYGTVWPADGERMPAAAAKCTVAMLSSACLVPERATQRLTGWDGLWWAVQCCCCPQQQCQGQCMGWDAMFVALKRSQNLSCALRGLAGRCQGSLLRSAVHSALGTNGGVSFFGVIYFLCQVHNSPGVTEVVSVCGQAGGAGVVVTTSLYLSVCALCLCAMQALDWQANGLTVVSACWCRRVRSEWADQHEEEARQNGPVPCAAGLLPAIYFQVRLGGAIEHQGFTRLGCGRQTAGLALRAYVFVCRMRRRGRGVVRLCAFVHACTPLAVLLLWCLYFFGWCCYWRRQQLHSLCECLYNVSVETGEHSHLLPLCLGRWLWVMCGHCTPLVHRRVVLNSKPCVQLRGVAESVPGSLAAHVSYGCSRLLAVAAAMCAKVICKQGWPPSALLVCKNGWASSVWQFLAWVLAL